MAKRYSDKKRQEYCNKWSASGLSKIKFCKDEKISGKALHKWLKIYGPQGCLKQKEAAIKFITPEFATKPEENKTLDILLPNGVQIKTEVKSVAELIRELLL